MPTVIYFTPAEWEEKEGTDPSKVDPKEALLLEIYNQLYQLNSSTPIDMQQFYATTDGTADYTNVALIGKTVQNVFVGGILLDPATDWTFNATTGTITFINVPDTGISLLIQYTA